MAAYRTLAIAAATGRLGFVYLEDKRLVEWGISTVAAQSIENATLHTTKWLGTFKPELVVTEAINDKCLKGGHSIALIAAIEHSVQSANVLNATVTRHRAYENKYQEAEALAQDFPELSPRLAEKPAIWRREPRRMIIFEALSMALQVRHEDLE